MAETTTHDVLKRYWPAMLLSIAGIAVIFLILYKTVRQNLLNEVRDHAKAIAMCASSSLDPASIKQITSTEDMGKPIYRDLQKALRQFKVSTVDISYIYLMRRVKGGADTDYEYLVDLAAEDWNGNGIIDVEERSEPVGNLYDASELPAMVHAWQEADADPDISPDPPYPDLLSGYAPIKDKSGQTIAIVGVDILAKTIGKKLYVTRVVFIIAAILLSMLMIAVIYLYASLRIASEHTESLNVMLERQNEQLESVLQMRNDLSHMIIHDMRNPLTVISSCLDLLEVKGKVLDLDCVETFGNARVQITRMKGLLQDMLLLAKSDSGTLLLNKQETNLKQLVDDVIKSNRLLAETLQVQLTEESQGEHFVLAIDRELITRVMENLVSNAIKHSPENAVVSITLSHMLEPRTGVQLRVADQGDGIDPKLQEKIFDQFTSGTNDPTKEHSIGLGLAFCKMTMDAHHGKIYVENNQPKGSVFVVELS